MNVSNSQLDFGLSFDYDRETQEQLGNQQRLELYKLKFANKYILIVFTLFIFQLKNVLIHGFLYTEISFRNYIIKKLIN